MLVWTGRITFWSRLCCWQISIQWRCQGPKTNIHSLCVSHFERLIYFHSVSFHNRGAFEWSGGPMDSQAHIRDLLHGNRSIGVSRATRTHTTVKLTVGRVSTLEEWQWEELEGDILHTNLSTAPPVGFMLCILALSTMGVAPNPLFMRSYPSKACGILLSNSKCFLHFVF